jgi:hypothetical protein
LNRGGSYKDKVNSEDAALPFVSQGKKAAALHLNLGKPAHLKGGRYEGHGKVQGARLEGKVAATSEIGRREILRPNAGLRMTFGQEQVSLRHGT